MKRLFIVLACLLLPLVALPAQDLKKEWKKYERMARKDRPRDQIAKLHEIRALAIERRLPDDLLRACREEEWVQSHLNWKTSDSVRLAMREVVESYGEPLLTYLWLGKDLRYALAHKAELEAWYQPNLQDRKIPFVQTKDEDDIQNDFEWILWDCITSNPDLIPDSEIYRLLARAIGDRYPVRPYLSYLAAQKRPVPSAAMQDLAKKYKYDPFRFIPEKAVLEDRWKRLQKDKCATEADFKALYDDIVAFEKAEKAAKGVNRRMNLSLDHIRKQLTASSVNISFLNDSIILTGRNFGRGKMTFLSEDKRETVSFRHRNERFYVEDKCALPIPQLPDGYYTVTSDYGGRSSYQKHTLSLAIRRQGDDYAVYVTDYQTGEPLPSATVRLKDKKEKKVLEREVSLNGFTPLPTDFQRKLGKKDYSLEVWYGDRRSAPVNVNKLGKEVVEAPPTLLHARVFKDRGAFRPGDTLKAKAVLFKGDLRDQVKTLPAGKNVQIWIFNAERKKLAYFELKTNAFGSVAWEWAIPEGERNGLWNIDVVYDGSPLARSSFRVDDFVLPTFDVTFDPEEKPFVPDSLFDVSGKVVSYSGHPVDGIVLNGVLTRSGKDFWSGPVSIDKDGAFRLSFKLSDTGDYRLILKATDATGETRDFEHRLMLSTNLILGVELKNAASGDFSFHSSTLEKTILTESVGRIVWNVRNGDRSVRMPVRYWVVDAKGNSVRNGTSEETLELDLSDCPDGLYSLHAIVEAGDSYDQTSLRILKMTSGLGVPVRSVFLTGETEIEYGERIRARLGAGDGPLWAVATLFAPDGSVLESRMVHLDGDNSLMDLGFVYKGNYPDAVRLEVFYFRDAQQVTHEAVYHRVRHSMDLPLSFSRFEDRTRPGAPVTLSLQTEPGVEAAVAVFDKSLDAMAPNAWKRVDPLPPTFRKTWSRTVTGRISGKSFRVRSNNVDVGVGEGPVWGIVTDEAGVPIMGASIVVKGTTQGTLTDVDGHFSLDVPAGTLLEIACLGYETSLETAFSGMEVILWEDTTMLDEVVVIGYGVSRKSVFTGSVETIGEALSGKAAGLSASPGIRVRGMATTVPEETYVEDMPEVSDEEFREIFSEALAFEPCLYPDKDGKVDVTFKASDKLSTYHVNVLAHDPTMRNAVLQRDFVVTVPVKISVTAPRYLYEEDRYVLSASVSNISEEDLSGRLYLKVEMDDAVEDRQPTYAQAADLTVPAGGSAAALFTLTAPPSFQPSFVGWWDDPHFDLRLVFEGDGFTDALRLSVPVNRAEQTLTECHSALAGPEAADSLRRMFVNVPGDQAEMTLRTLREVAEEGLAQWTAPEDPDAISRSADFYARALLGRDTTGILAPLMALRCEDGGFAWTEGMDSSPIVTATLLERFAVLRDKRIAIPDMTKTVQYLDYCQFGNWCPRWCGGLSDEEYMDIRAMWAYVPFDLSGVEKKAVRRFRLKAFRQFARRYLTPGKYDYANGWILDKARRVRTLQNLLASEAGIALGQAWGETLFTASRFEKSIANDLISLKQYAVRHPSGGLYYPNAVLPFRSLLSSEVYAHTLLAGLMDGPVSDGVRLWLSLQNETQSWTDEPAYVDALQLILSSSDDLLNRQIVTLTASDTVPFKDIQASGNEMRIDRKFYREVQEGQRSELKPGDPLRVGDKIIATYVLWSKENRSFVRVDAFREACFVPADQLSGPVHSSFRVRIDGTWSRFAQCYRDVRIDRTAWWLDVCPEETTHWEESFFVTQAGTFTAPVLTVESLYAPQYRANAAFSGPVNTDVY